MTSLCLSSSLSLLFGSCLFSTLIKWLKNYPIAQLRPGLASNVNFAQRTLDNGRVWDTLLIWTRQTQGGEFWAKFGLILLVFTTNTAHMGTVLEMARKGKLGQGWECITVNWQQQTSWKSFENIKFEKELNLDEILFWAHVEDWLVKHWSRLLAVLGNPQPLVASSLVHIGPK